MVHAAIRLATDRHPMAGIKMIMSNGDVLRRPAAPGFDGNVVIAGAYIRMGNRDVGGRRRINAVSVTGIGRGIDPYTPCGESVGFTDDYMKVGRVAKSNTVESKVIGRINHQQAGTILPGIFHL